MVTVVVFKFCGMGCQPLRRALGNFIESAYGSDMSLWKYPLKTGSAAKRSG
ncbi:hypothetical protein VCHE25_3846 [Vibrio cholerae HE-25]|nr:hypothetical protein VCHE25_3846 [Vibrio cholerae HE-25]